MLLPRRDGAAVAEAVASIPGVSVVRRSAGGAEPVIRVGNLEAIRDFTDVRDTVRAYWLAVNHAKPGEVYNICTGNPITIQELSTVLSIQRAVNTF